jgi:WhiB family redox-sensing transcriptional regulator
LLFKSFGIQEGDFQMTKHQKANMGLELDSSALLVNLQLPRFSETPACARATVLNPDIFCGDKPADVAAAKAICVTCPVIDQCLSYSLQIKSSMIWGGHTAKERMKLRRSLDLAPQLVDAEAVENLRLIRSGMSSKALAKHFNVSERTVQRWRKDAGVADGTVTSALMVVA